jgi:hypothetical protein
MSELRPILAIWMTIDIKDGRLHHSGSAWTRRGNSTKSPLIEIQAPTPNMTESMSTSGTRLLLDDDSMFVRLTCQFQKEIFSNDLNDLEHGT